MRYLSLAGAVLLAVCHSAWAEQKEGPFGVVMGEDPATYGCRAMEPAGLYRCEEPPKPHPDMELYIVQAQPGIGICWVKAIGRPVEIDGSGAALKAETDDIAAQVAKNYGKSKFEDHLLPGSIWNEPEDWSMGVSRNEREYSYNWDMSAGSDLRNNVSKIYVSAEADSRYEGYVITEFYFSNYKDCENLAKERKSDVF